MRKGRTFDPGRTQLKDDEISNRGKTWPVSTLLKKVTNDNEPKMKLQPKLPILRYDREWTYSRPKGWPHHEGPRNEEPLEFFGPKQRRKTQSRIQHNCETLPKVQNSQLKRRVSTKLWPDRERIPNTASNHNGDPIAKTPTNRLPRTLSNRQVSMTPESQSKARAEPQSSKQKTQY